MRAAILGIILCLSFSNGFSQAGGTLDVEFDTYCMMDSIGPNNEVEFVRLYYYNRAEYKDVTADLSTSYTVQGTPLPCWQLTGTKECYLMNHSVQRTMYAYGVAGNQQTDRPDDYWLVALRLQEHGAQSLLSKRLEYVIPLNYPYGNNTREAARLKADIIEYFECKGICWYSVLVDVGGYSISPTIDILWYGMGVATYSTNPASPNPVYIQDNPFLIIQPNGLCSMVHEVYRKEKNGAVLYYVDPDGVINAPPLPGSKEKVPCSEDTEHVSHCDRPSGGQECWVSTLQDRLCTYTFIIPDSVTIDTIWSQGVPIIEDTYCPAFVSGCPNHDDLRTALTGYYFGLDAWGQVSVNNTVNGQVGFILTVTDASVALDSIRDGDGVVHYPIIEDCHQTASYMVHRNELGGIINCQDQYGHDTYCPPENARRVSCSAISGPSGCQSQSKWGTEVVSSTKQFDLTRFWSFSYLVVDTPVVVMALSYSGDTTTFNCPVGYSEDYSSGDPCKRIETSFLKITASGSGQVKVSYGW